MILDIWNDQVEIDFEILTKQGEYVPHKEIFMIECDITSYLVYRLCITQLWSQKIPVLSTCLFIIISFIIVIIIKTE